jgi:cyclase
MGLPMANSQLPHLRISEPHPGLFAYYDGRVPGYSFMPETNWVDDGAIGLGIATYALVAGEEALVYDTHVSPQHGAAIRAHLEGLGATRFTVVYSHWHLDHVAGTVAFAGAPVIANQKTAQHLQDRHLTIEAGTQSGPPAIKPLILPHRTFSGRLEFMLGRRNVVLLEANIHSDDATVLWLPDEAILLAGDTVEDCVTYVGDPQNLAIHLSELDRLAALQVRTVLPDHGSAEVPAGPTWSSCATSRAAWRLQPHGPAFRPRRRQPQGPGLGARPRLYLRHRLTNITRTCAPATWMPP